MVFPPSALCGPRRIVQRSWKFARQTVESSLGGEVYGFSEMADHVEFLRECYAPFVGKEPRTVGLEYCESAFTHLLNQNMVA